MIRVSHHAIDRYIERVENVSREQALEAILAHTTVLNLAAAFGAAKVRLPSGVRLVVDNGCVVTVVGCDKKRRARPTRGGWGVDAGRTGDASHNDANH